MLAELAQMMGTLRLAQMMGMLSLAAPLVLFEKSRL